MASLYTTTEIEPAFDLTRTSNRRAFNVGEFTFASIQANLVNGSSWASAILTMKRSNDGILWFAFTTNVALSDSGITGIMDVSGYSFVAAEVTTVASSAASVQLICTKKRTNTTAEGAGALSP